jgi:hypothetical protein
LDTPPVRDHECDVCRVGPYPEAAPSEGKRALHLHASAGIDIIKSMDKVHHLLPIGLPIPPSAVVTTRESMRWTDVQKEPTPPNLMELYRRINARGAASYPLIFQGEVLGSIGMIAVRPLQDDEYELLGIGG